MFGNIENNTSKLRCFTFCNCFNCWISKCIEAVKIRIINIQSSRDERIII